MTIAREDCLATGIMTSDSRVLLFFIDGLGIGTRGPHNPFDGLSDAAPLAIFHNELADIPFAGILAPTDACLGIEGRPQSASGQTTILTGVQALFGPTDSRCTNISSPIRSDMLRIMTPLAESCRCWPVSFARCFGI